MNTSIREFKDPWDVLLSATLSNEERTEILQRWRGAALAAGDQQLVKRTTMALLEVQNATSSLTNNINRS